VKFDPQRWFFWMISLMPSASATSGSSHKSCVSVEKAMPTSGAKRCSRPSRQAHAFLWSLPMAAVSGPNGCCCFLFLFIPSKTSMENQDQIKNLAQSTPGFQAARSGSSQVAPIQPLASFRLPPHSESAVEAGIWLGPQLGRLLGER